LPFAFRQEGDVWRRARAPDLPTILLAEKSDSLRHLLGKLLAEEGYRVLGAGTRRAVLEQLRNAPRIDLVIADGGIRGMPVWDVVQETTWLRPGVPFVRLIEERTDALPAYGVGPSSEALLQKPVTIIALLAAIERLLATAQAAPTMAQAAARTGEASAAR
jgi:DNA-binding response OmpR family regulator